MSVLRSWHSCLTCTEPITTIVRVDSLFAVSSRPFPRPVFFGSFFSRCPLAFTHVSFGCADVGRPCKSPNCKTGLGEGSSAVFDDNRREQVVREITGELDDPREVLRGAPGTDEYRATTGLRNLGATCFMNALYQVLFATTPFRHGVYLFRAPPVLPKGETKESLAARLRVIEELQLLFARMQDGNRNWLRPDIFPKLLNFETGEQQDVQEFFMLLLAHYCDGCFRLCDETKSLFGDLFGGHQEVSIRCDKCHNTSERRELFYVLQLPLCESVLESLYMAIQCEKLDGDNMYDCSSCLGRNPATRSTKLLAPVPPVLVLQVIRFHYDVRQNNKIKKMTKVSAPRALDMTRFVGNPKDVSDEELQYELYAVVLHIGLTAHGGHYVAHVLQDNGMWVEMDDEETRSLLPEEVGLTISMRTGASRKHGDDDDGDHVDGGDEDFEVWSDEVQVMSGARGGKRGAGGGGARRGGGKKKGPAVAVEDLEHFTKGSSAPYLLFYRRRRNNWGRIAPVPPAYTSAQVTRENEALLQLHTSYVAVADETYRELDDLEDLHDAVVAEVDMSKPFCWLSLEWLRKWAAHNPETDKVPAVDNVPIMCEHGGVGPQTLLQMKRISLDAWDRLIVRYGGGPLLVSGSECKQCALLHCRSSQNTMQEDELSKIIKAELKNEPLRNSPFFYMSEEWLARWKRGPKGGLLDSKINACLICEHGCLTPDEEKFVRVTSRVWNHFKERWPDAVEVPKKMKQCIKCAEANEEMDRWRQAVKKEREELDERIGGDLMSRKAAYVLSEMEPGEKRILSKTWVDKYRSYIQDPNMADLGKLDNSDLFCEHHLLKLRLIEEVDVGDGGGRAKALRSFFIVDCAQWKKLTGFFKGSVGEISLTVNGDRKLETGVEECSACYEAAYMMNAEFQNKDVTIRRATGGRSTATSYHLRATKKPSMKSENSASTTKDCQVCASATDTVFDLKLKICQFVDSVDPDAIVLRFADAVMENEFVLSSYRVAPGSVIDMEVQLNDGLVLEDADVGDAPARSTRRKQGPQRERKPEKGFQGSFLTKDFAVSSGSDENDKSPTSASGSAGATCTKCTYVSYVSSRQCEMCEAPFE